VGKVFINHGFQLSWLGVSEQFLKKAFHHPKAILIPNDSKQIGKSERKEDR